MCGRTYYNGFTVTAKPDDSLISNPAACAKQARTADRLDRGDFSTPMAFALNNGQSFHSAEVLFGRPDGSRISLSVAVERLERVAVVEC
jgi:hypothetical protein